MRIQHSRGATGGQECIGDAGRRFTLGKDEAGGVTVLDMTGPRRS